LGGSCGRGGGATATDADFCIARRHEVLLIEKELSIGAGCAATDPDVCRGLVRMPDELSVRAGWAATDPDVCNGPRQASFLPEDGFSVRAGCCDETDPEVCSGLRQASLLPEEGSSVRAGCWEETDPEVCSGLRQSLFALDESICAPVTQLIACISSPRTERL
jgi:hypothetical protein